MAQVHVKKITLRPCERLFHLLCIVEKPKAFIGLSGRKGKTNSPIHEPKITKVISEIISQYRWSEEVRNVMSVAYMS